MPLTPPPHRLKTLLEGTVKTLGSLLSSVRRKLLPAIVAFLLLVLRPFRAILSRLERRFGGPVRFYFLMVPGAAAFAIFLLSASVFVEFMIDRPMIVRTMQEQKRWLEGRGELVQKEPIQIFARDNSLMGEFLPERDSRINMKTCGEMKWLPRAAVSAEDRYFFHHHGVSIRGVFRAIVNDIRHMELREGAGSITMQLARNLFTDRSPTIFRKIYETYAAFQIESMLNKKEILCLYLNKIYMGEGRVGAEEASWYYFRKPPELLSAPEAAMIVGLFPSPVRYSPQNNIRLSLKKQNLVLATLVRDGFLKEGEKKRMMGDFLTKYDVRPSGENPSPGTIGAYGASRDFRLHHPAPAANEYVRQFLFKNLPEEIIRQGGLKVYTTIDMDRQRAALEAVRSVVEETRRKMMDVDHVNRRLLRRIVERLNSVMVTLNPRTGDVLSVVGGYTVTEGGSMTNRIWNMRRQPGSTIKGFLYAVAIDENKLALDSSVMDEPFKYGKYTPKNWYHDYYGEMTLRRAVAMSVNTVAVRTLQDVGVDRFREKLAQALGLGYFESLQRFPGSLSLALGSGEMTPMELATLYAVLLNDGKSVRPRIVLRVVDSDGHTIWEDSKESEPAERILSERAAASAIDLMRSVIEESDGTASWIGKEKERNHNFLPFPVAGKSGTVQVVPAVRRKYRGMRGVHDAWFVGLVPSEVSIVWVGQDEGAPFPGSGSGLAGVVWVRYAHEALPGRVDGDFPVILTPQTAVSTDGADAVGFRKGENSPSGADGASRPLPETHGEGDAFENALESDHPHMAANPDDDGAPGASSPDSDTGPAETTSPDKNSPSDGSEFDPFSGKD